MQPPVVFDRDTAVADRFAPLATDPTEALDPDRVPDDAALAASTAGPAPGSAEERAVAATGPMVTFPVSAAQRADEKARAAAYGVPAGSDNLPVGGDATGAEVASTDQGAPKITPGKGRITDASEGTKLDPLLDKTYDLNSAKTVPTFTVSDAQPPALPARAARATLPAVKPPRRQPVSRPAAAAPPQ